MTRRTAAIIVNWNNHALTRRAIDSLKRSESKCHIVVVDNGSSDKEYYPLKEISDIKLIRSDENLGFGRGNNLGIRWAFSNTDCEYIFLLNNDATATPETAGMLESVLDNNPDIGMAAPRIVYSDNPDILWYGGGGIKWHKGGVVIYGFRGPSDSREALTAKDVSFASGCAMMLRRAVLEQTGGFDPRFFLYEEDVELCLRVIESGWRIRYVPQTLVFHMEQGSHRKKGEGHIKMFDSQNPKLHFFLSHMTKNKLLTFHTHAKGIRFYQFWLCFPVFWTLKCSKLILYNGWGIIPSVIKGVLGFIKDKNIDADNKLIP